MVNNFTLGEGAKVVVVNASIWYFHLGCDIQWQSMGKGLVLKRVWLTKCQYPGMAGWREQEVMILGSPKVIISHNIL
jgi:hypothetical protein